MRTNKMVIPGVCLLTLLGLEMVCPAASFATASTHIWAPSTDVQSFGVVHLTSDAYIPVEKDSAGHRPNVVTNMGLTTGILPFEKLNAEAGFDHKTGYSDLDDTPMYFNAKLGVPENAFFEFSPAIAGGVYDMGTESDKTDFNVAYVKAAKTVAIDKFSLGRFSAGYFNGNSKLLLDQNGDEDNDGLLAAWERSLPEISDKLWVCAEYQGSNSGYGTWNYGFSWKFSDNASVIFALDTYNNHNLADTFTVQVDIDFDAFSKLFKK